MLERDPNTATLIGQIITFLWVTALAVWGGAVGYLNKIKDRGLKFSLKHLVAELFTSGFVGWCTYLLCSYAHFNDQITAVMIAISGHMGTRAIFRLEKFWEVLLGKPL